MGIESSIVWNERAARHEGGSLVRPSAILSVIPNARLAGSGPRAEGEETAPPRLRSTKEQTARGDDRERREDFGLFGSASADE